MHPDWVRQIRDQCAAAGVPFFLKQWGEWSPDVPPPDKHLAHHDFDHPHHNFRVYRWGKRAAGAMLDGREWRDFPEQVYSQAIERPARG